MLKLSNEDARINHVGKAGFFKRNVNFDDMQDSEARIDGIGEEERERPYAKALGVASGCGRGGVKKATYHGGGPACWESRRAIGSPLATVASSLPQ